MHSKGKNGIPDRWTDYTAVGKRIPGTRFIAFKVPLKQSFRSRLTQPEAFEPFDLVHMLEKEGQELGLIIDLTFTTRYYTVVDLPNTLYHLKIFTAGHEVPNNATILSFKKAVRHFLHDNENNDKLIGVHCTHGLNRTGYLICRYLIDVDGMKPQKAINLFNASRGHSIERQNYLDDLKNGPKRSNVGMEKPDQEPSQGRAGETRDEAPHHRREQHNHDPPYNGRGSHQVHRNPQHQFFNVEVEEPNHEPFRGLANERRHEAPHHRREPHNHDPPFNGRESHQVHRNPQHQFFNVEVEEPNHDPFRDLANERRHEAPHHQREQHNHDPPFNGRESHQVHRNPQHQFFPFQQRDNMTSFRAPEPQSFRPPLFPHPPAGVRQTRPGFPNQSVRGFYFSPSAPYQLPHHEPRHNPHAPPDRSTRPPGPHRKPRHRDRTPR